MKVHPVADILPMLSDAELAEMAADIKTNGQIYEIVTAEIAGEELLLDGRNRLRACEIAGVEPRFKQLNGSTDPIAFIASANLRRDHTVGQRAIWAAMAEPHAATRHETGRGKKSPISATFPLVDHQRLAEARVIVAYAPDLAEQILRKIGDVSFSAAFNTAKQRRKAKQDNEDKMARLRREAPDLADLHGMSLEDAIKELDERNAQAALVQTIRESHPDLVERIDANRLSVNEALAIAHDRDEKKRAAQIGATKWLFQVVSLFHDGDAKKIAEDLMSNYRTQYWPPEHEPLTADRLDFCATVLERCAIFLEESDERQTTD